MERRGCKDFVMLSLYNGLRISDVATSDVEKRLKGNDVFLRMHKTRQDLYTWIPDWLGARLRQREMQCGPQLFRTGESAKVSTATKLWRERIDKSGVPSCAFFWRRVFPSPTSQS
jgi:hypothetical protein